MLSAFYSYSLQNSIIKKKKRSLWVTCDLLVARNLMQFFAGRVDTRLCCWLGKYFLRMFSQLLVSGLFVQVLQLPQFLYYLFGIWPKLAAQGIFKLFLLRIVSICSHASMLSCLFSSTVVQTPIILNSRRYSYQPHNTVLPGERRCWPVLCSCCSLCFQIPPKLSRCFFLYPLVKKHGIPV